jgi:hypothetical protein
MNAIAYKTRVASPFPVATRQPQKVKLDPVREEVNKLLGTYQFSATFELDTQTAATLKHIPGVIAFICTIRKGDQIIGQGRGTTAINQINRFIVRTINYAFNASLVDAVIRATKLLDIYRPDIKPHSWGGSDTAGDSFDCITDKQKSYLTELIQNNVNDEDEREGWLSQLDELTREEASQAIQRFAK